MIETDKTDFKYHKGDGEEKGKNILFTRGYLKNEKTKKTMRIIIIPALLKWKGSVTLDGKRLDEKEIEELAEKSGFVSARGFWDFFREPFTGFIKEDNKEQY